MTDLFADFVSDEFIDRMFAVMALTPQHTYQVLTKRPQRMREYCHTLGGHHESDRVSLAMKKLHAETGYGANGAWYTAGDQGWHFANIWLGTSCEDQKTADARIPHLLATPAAVRFLSCEPLLGPLDLTNAVHVMAGECWNYLAGWRGENIGADDAGRAMFLGPGDEHLGYDGPPKGPGIDWVICGGESGPHARPMHPDWARSLRDQCAAAGVAFHFKQWGEHHPAGERWGDGGYSGTLQPSEAVTFAKKGKAISGRYLDGRTHDEFPVAA
jgi:protein gp37